MEFRSARRAFQNIYNHSSSENGWWTRFICHASNLCFISTGMDISEYIRGEIILQIASSRARCLFARSQGLLICIVNFSLAVRIYFSIFNSLIPFHAFLRLPHHKSILNSIFFFSFGQINIGRVEKYTQQFENTMRLIFVSRIDD